jgi:hypothetical protein
MGGPSSHPLTQPNGPKARCLEDILLEFGPTTSVSYEPFQTEPQQVASACLPTSFPQKPCLGKGSKRCSKTFSWWYFVMSHFVRRDCRARFHNFHSNDVIVGLDATTKGPSPLVGESKVSCESKVFCSKNNYFTFIRILHTNN